MSLQFSALLWFCLWLECTLLESIMRIVDVGRLPLPYSLFHRPVYSPIVKTKLLYPLNNFTMWSSSILSYIKHNCPFSSTYGSLSEPSCCLWANAMEITCDTTIMQHLQRAAIFKSDLGYFYLQCEQGPSRFSSHFLTHSPAPFRWRWWVARSCLCCLSEEK